MKKIKSQYEELCCVNDCAAASGTNLGDVELCAVVQRVRREVPGGAQQVVVV